LQKIKSFFKTAGTRNGTFSIGMTVMVIAIIVVVNLVFGQLPEKYRNIDVSSTKIYEITDTSRELLKNLNTKVTFTVLAEKESTDDRIKTFLSKYSALSKDIKVDWIDPVLHPSALTEYDTQENTIVVSCDDSGKSTTISFDDIIVVDSSSYYYTGTASESSFDGEGQLTSAVNYVTGDVNKTIYRTTGHGESTLSSSVTELMSKNNYTTEELNLLMDGAIPEDCDLLLMYAPATDLSEDETKAVTDYLAQGGKIMILLGETSTADLPNLSSLLKVYGMEEADGYIADPDRAYQGNYYYIFPNLSLTGDMAKGISSQMVLLTNAKGLNMVDPERDTITTTSFMSTSENAYAVTEDNQTQGTYTLGAVATEQASTGNDAKSQNSDSEKSDATDDNTDKDAVESRLMVISAASLIDSQITDSFAQLENTTLFMNAVSSNFDGVQNISIEPKSLAAEYNTVQHAGAFSLLVVFGIPLLVLVSGFAVWFKRRKA
jgi:ABC-2 type transport system permease protein